jgi:hypothetical protein
MGAMVPVIISCMMTTPCPWRMSHDPSPDQRTGTPRSNGATSSGVPDRPPRETWRGESQDGESQDMVPSTSGASLACYHSPVDERNASSRVGPSRDCDSG